MRSTRAVLIINFNRCNGIYPHVGRPCPAKGKTCKSCGKLNHFAGVCRSKQQGKHEASTSKFKKSEQSVGNQKKRPLQHSVNRIDATKESTTVMIGKENIEFIVDTGATVNLIEESDYSRLENVTLQRTSTKIFPYDSKVPLKILGKFETVIETREKMTCAEFYVVKKNTKSCGPLICYETAHELGLVTVVNQVHDVDPPIPTTLLNEYKENF